MKNRANLYEPYLTKSDNFFIKKSIDEGWVSTAGKNIDKFEKKISDLVKVKYCLALNSGTSSLDISLKVLGINSNHAVLVPSATFIAPINAILYNQAEPIFFDIDENLNINTSDVIKFLKEETIKKGDLLISKKNKKIIKAIIIVHVFGKPADIFALKEICKLNNIKLIEDASESLGSYYIKNKNKIHTGIIGDIGCLSFNGNKIITTGSGGMLMTNNKTYYKQAKYLSTQSKDNAVYFIHNNVGYNLRMNNISASLGLSQLNKIDYILSKKQDDYELYQKLITNKNLELMQPTKNTISNNWLNIIKIKKKISFKKLKQIIKILHKQNVYVRPLWYPNHLQKFLKKYIRYNLQSINSIFTQIICLPSSPSLKNKTIIEISKIINKIKI